MTEAIDPSVTLIAQSSSPVPAIARWPWALPVAATCIGWLSMLVLSHGEGRGHLHHLLVVTAMSVAMMSPLAIPLCVTAARSSLWSTATRCVVVGFAAFVGAWIATGAVLHLLTEVAIAIATPGAVVFVLAAWCAIDVMSRRRAARLTACAVTRPLFPRSSTVRVADLGVVAASRCMATCWAPMALAVAQPGLAVPVSGVIVLERLITPRPRWSMVIAYGLGAAWGLASIWR